jgi:C-terminal processing protease CtpA/Prc
MEIITNKVMNMKKSLLIITSVILISSCASVEKYNKQISVLHSPEEIRADIDYSYNLLQKLHPDLYWFIEKDSLDKEFSKLSSSITEPMLSEDFYKKLAPVVSSIRQGHTSVSPPYKKQTKKEKKLIGKRSSPFKSVYFKEIDNRIYVDKIFSNDSTLLIGSELLFVDDEPTKDILKNYQKVITSDGFNETFYPNIKGIEFGTLYQRIYKSKDSIVLNLKIKDSIYSHFLVAEYKKSTDKVDSKDTTAIEKKKKLSKLERKLAKQKRRDKEEWESKYGYIKYKKEKTRSLEFIHSDSTNVVAYMKIRRFRHGVSKDFYEESFMKIDSAKCKNLIIDLRDNLGGSVKQIDDLYSYLTDKDYTFLEEAKMTSRFSYLYPFTHSKSPLIKSLTILTYPVHTLYLQIFKVKTKGGKHYFKLKQAKLKTPKINNYKEAVYVIINGASFSASTTFSTHLKATKRAIFVGEETGGSFNSTVAGIFTNAELPNSKISMRFGVMTLSTPYKDSPDGYGVKADIQIPTTVFDKDEQLEWILNDIKEKN